MNNLWIKSDNYRVENLAKNNTEIFDSIKAMERIKSLIKQNNTTTNQLLNNFKNEPNFRYCSPRRSRYG